MEISRFRDGEMAREDYSGVEVASGVGSGMMGGEDVEISGEIGGSESGVIRGVDEMGGIRGNSKIVQ